jgi:hypothetical protein
MAGTDVKWYTDTEHLSAQYSRLAKFQFAVLPIPTGEGSVRRRISSRPLLHGYLGDARTEKGFQHLSDIWDRFRLWSNFGNDKLLVQSNFNIKGGEPEAVRGMLALLGQTTGEVQFVPGPLETEEYDAVLSSCGIILLPYDGAAYASRSSGIFAEAIHKAIPTVVTGGSWGAKVVEPIRQAWLQRIENAFMTVSRVISPPASSRRGHSWGVVYNCGNYDTALFTFDFLAPSRGAGLVVELHLRDSEDRLLAILSDVVMVISTRVRIAFALPMRVDRFEVRVRPFNKEVNIIPQKAGLLVGVLQSGFVCGFGVRSANADPESFAACELDLSRHLADYDAQALALKNMLKPLFDDAVMIECLIAGEGIVFSEMYSAAEQMVDDYFKSKLPLHRSQSVIQTRWDGVR